MEKNDITPKLILLSEFLDQSKRKDKEIAFYERELKKIEHKLYWLRREKDLTQTIISIISEEKVLDIKEEMEKRLIDGNKKHVPVTCCIGRKVAGWRRCIKIPDVVKNIHQFG